MGQIQLGQLPRVRFHPSKRLHKLGSLSFRPRNRPRSKLLLSVSGKFLPRPKNIPRQTSLSQSSCCTMKRESVSRKTGRARWIARSARDVLFHRRFGAHIFSLERRSARSTSQRLKARCRSCATLSDKTDIFSTHISSHAPFPVSVRLSELRQVPIPGPVASTSSPLK